MNRIEQTFLRLKKQGRKAFIPYVMAGDPNLKKTEEVVSLFEECGADIVELGVPFTDPLADGPVIQAASERALKEGVTLKKVLALVRKMRRAVSLPIVLMTYFNPVFKLGVEAFVAEATEAGVDGVIIPDLPPDEADEVIRASKKRAMATVFLLAPTSTEERIALVAEKSEGFIYYVSITGITGSELKGLRQMRAMIKRIRGFTDKPIAVGFGVKRPEEARGVAEIADGVIVGSAIVKKLQEGNRNLKEYLYSLRRAIDGVV
jgi:tryptophan synthase alpha chain